MNQLDSIAANVVHSSPSAVIDHDKILTTLEVAEWLRLKPGTLEKARSTAIGNYPPYIRLGGRRIGYRYGDVASWLQANRCSITGHPVKD